MVEYVFISIEAIGFLTTLVIAIVKACQKSQTDSRVDIFEELPHLLIRAEQIIGDGHGESKLDYVLSYVESQCIMRGIEYDRDFWKDAVERVLCAPQKK